MTWIVVARAGKPVAGFFNKIHNMIHSIAYNSQKTGYHLHPMFNPTMLTGTFTFHDSCLYDFNYSEDHLHDHNRLIGFAQYHHRYQCAYIGWKRTWMNHDKRIRLIAVGRFQSDLKCLHIVNVKVNVPYQFEIRQFHFVTRKGYDIKEGYSFKIYDLEGKEWGNVFVLGMILEAAFGYALYPKWMQSSGAPHDMRLELRV